MTFEVELLDWYQGIRCAHILLKHKDTAKPVVGHKGNKPVTRTKEEAKDEITKIRDSIVGGQDF